MVVAVAPGASYYFCMRSFDESYNASALSNSPLIDLSNPQITVIGDVNNSGAVNGLDVVYLVNSLKGKSTIPEPEIRADVNGLPGVNGLDAVYLRAYLCGGPSPIGMEIVQSNPSGR
jgi:hypothetical protein